VRIPERAAVFREVAEAEQVHRVARGADLAIDLVAPLQLALVECAERPLEAEGDVARLLGLAGGLGGRGDERQPGGRDQRDQDGLHGRGLSEGEGHGDQPRVSGWAGAPAGIAAGPPSTGSEIDCGIGNGVSRRPTIGRITRKKAK